MNPVLLVPSTERIVALDDVKAHLRVQHDAEDWLIEGLIDTAHSYMDGLDGPLGRCLTPQTWRITTNRIGYYWFTFPDVQSVIGADWTPPNRYVQIAEAGNVDFVCAIPATLLPTARQAMMLLIGNWYENRHAAGEQRYEVPMAFEMLVDRLRRMTV